MAAFTIALTEDRALKLQELARQAGTTPEELLRQSVEEWLFRPREDFAQAAAYVLKKNSDLYRRLA